ncbi:hypothetical protein LPJ64_001473 [Coemansia asiatica]|uniref:Cleavage and polyadenylation specificity factor subunit 2 n=1 Tax=Coemansia asiatica TaxID=1052880 RepID=A0A9W8CLE8_9FUNG|nr:hypothetical protein LPJ64_001473 [Coemansia asiatica]
MSTNSLQFTAISGANNEDAVCYILEIDDTKIMLDCGSFEDYSSETLAQLQRVARQVDAVLLSHPDAAHVGAYPLAYSRYGMTCPAYATQAVGMMGRLCMLDIAKSLKAREDFILFDEKDVNQAFDNITPLQYSQPMALSGKHSGIVVTAYSAGHTIGGSIWTISNGTEVVLYAMDFNYVKEELLNRGSLLEGNLGQVNPRLMRPTLLITDAYNALYKLPTRKRRVEWFLNSVANAVKRGGNVLIPVDSAARVLEIAYVLNEWWPQERSRKDNYTLYLLGRCAKKMISFAQSLTSWMADGIGQLASKDSKPFDLRHIVVVQSIEDLEKRMNGSGRRGRAKRAVVLASLEGMSMSFSQDLFVRWAAERRNAIILPQRGPPGSLTRDLFSRWWDRTQKRERERESKSAANAGPAAASATVDSANASANSNANANASTGAAATAVVELVELKRFSGTEIGVTLRRRIPLEGSELENWLAQEKRRKEQEAAREAMMQRNRMMLDADNMSSDSDSDDDSPMEMGMHSLRDLDTIALSEIDLEMERLRSGQSYDLYVKDRGRVRGLDAQNQSYCMFPFQEKIRRFDDYGEICDLEQFMEEVEIDESTNLAQDAMDKDYESEDNESQKDARPTKPIKEEMRVHLNCLLGFVDMEGRADGISASSILVQIMPKRVVIVHGTASSTQTLAEYCRDPQVPVTKEIYTPGIGETLNVSSGFNAYKLKLTDALFKQVRMREVGQGNMLGFVSGRIRFTQEDEIPVLDIDSTGLESAWQAPIMVGDSKLSSLRVALEARGIPAHFDSEGTLVCDGKVAIKRKRDRFSKVSSASASVPAPAVAATTGIQILGTPSQEYYAIRAIVYEHFAEI